MTWGSGAAPEAHCWFFLLSHRQSNQSGVSATTPTCLRWGLRHKPHRRSAIGRKEQRDELAPLYPNHVIPRAYAVWVRLKRTLASLAHFARCLGCRPFPPKGGGAMTAELYRATHPRHQGRGGGPPRGAARHHRGGQADDGPAGVLPGHGPGVGREGRERLRQGAGRSHGHAPGARAMTGSPTTPAGNASRARSTASRTRSGIPQRSTARRFGTRPIRTSRFG